MEDKFKKIINQAKKVALTKSEKYGVKLHLVKVIQENPVVAVPSFEYKTSFITALFSPSRMRYATVSLAAFLVICFVGAGVSTAAEGSLPGELLYPVKTEVNERVLGWFATSQEARAKLSIHLADKRMQEAEQIVAEGKLNAKIKGKIEVAFNKNIDNAQRYIKNTERDDGVAVDLNSILEGSLQAHVEIISQLSGEKTAEKSLTTMAMVKTDDDLGDLKENVTTRLESVKKQRETAQENALKNAEKVKEESQKRVEKAKSKVQDVKKIIEKKKSNLSKDNYKKANDNIKALDEVIADSEKKIEKEDYSGAFTSLQEVFRSSQEVKSGISADGKLKMEVDILKVTTQSTGKGIQIKFPR